MSMFIYGFDQASFFVLFMERNFCTLARRFYTSCSYFSKYFHLLGFISLIVYIVLLCLSAGSILFTDFPFSCDSLDMDLTNQFFTTALLISGHLFSLTSSSENWCFMMALRLPYIETASSSIASTQLWASWFFFFIRRILAFTMSSLGPDSMYFHTF